MTSQLLGRSAMHGAVNASYYTRTQQDACVLGCEIAAGPFETDQVEAESQVTANQHYAIKGLDSIHRVPETAMRFGVQRELSGLLQRLNVLPFSICERDRPRFSRSMITTTLSSFVYIGLWKPIQTTWRKHRQHLLSLLFSYSLSFVLGNLLSAIFVTEKNPQAFYWNQL